MRYLIFVPALVACGARSEIANEEPQPFDASIVDVTTSDSKLDAPVIAKDAGIDADASQLCCDDGIKKSGCQLCTENETCVAKTGTCITQVTDCGPTTCDGCCWTTTQCSDGKEVGTCGTAGQLCQTCFDTVANTYGSCVAQSRGGVCMGAPKH